MTPRALTSTALAALVAASLLFPAACTAQEPDSLFAAYLDFDPDALNLKSNGNWVTCYIGLSEGYDPHDIDRTSVTFMDSIPAVEHPGGVGDYDGDEVEELMVKFPRAEVGAMLAPGDSVEVWVSAYAGSLAFTATDTIRVFWPGGGDDPDGADDPDETDGGQEVLTVRLDQNVPNPFNPKTTITFATLSPGHVRLDVHDISGRLVATLVDRYLEEGEHEVSWDGLAEDGTPAGSGVYFYTVTGGGSSETRKSLLIK